MALLCAPYSFRYEVTLNEQKCIIMRYGIKKENIKESPCISNTFDKEDMCQPDMALTPQQILEHFTQGLPSPNLERKGYYDGDKYDYDDTLPEEYNDLVDVENEVRNFQERVNNLQQERDELKRREKDAKLTQSNENQALNDSKDSSTES